VSVFLYIHKIIYRFIVIQISKLLNKIPYRVFLVEISAIMRETKNVKKNDNR